MGWALPELQDTKYGPGGSSATVYTVSGITTPALGVGLFSCGRLPMVAWREVPSASGEPCAILPLAARWFASRDKTAKARLTKPTTAKPKRAWCGGGRQQGGKTHPASGRWRPGPSHWAMQCCGLLAFLADATEPGAETKLHVEWMRQDCLLD